MPYSITNVGAIIDGLPIAYTNQKVREDVSVSEAFELYMLKNFFDIKLNSLSEKILSFWENDFKTSLDKHLKYLNKNLENQEIYNAKFSK